MTNTHTFIDWLVTIHWMAKDALWPGFVFPTRAELADALTRLTKAGVALDGASDHGVSEALYLRDPDQNGIELYWDRPQEQWPRSPDGRVTMFTERSISTVCWRN